MVPLSMCWNNTIAKRKMVLPEMCVNGKKARYPQMNVYETILFTTFKFAHGNCYMAMPPQYTNNTINYVLIYHKSLNLNAKPKQQKKNH